MKMKTGTYYARAFEMWIDPRNPEIAQLLPCQPATTLLRTGTLQLDQLKPDAPADSVRAIGCTLRVRRLFNRGMEKADLELAVQSLLDEAFDEHEVKVTYCD